jgi:hypothetical protein
LKASLPDETRQRPKSCCSTRFEALNEPVGAAARVVATQQANSCLRCRRRRRAIQVAQREQRDDLRPTRR